MQEIFSGAFPDEILLPMPRNQCTADNEITEERMSRSSQNSLCKEENLRIQDFSTDIQQLEGQNRNKVQEMYGNIHKGVGTLEVDNYKWYLSNSGCYFHLHFQIHKTGLGWYLSITDSLEA